jgi:Holliday junction resolvasome RuvABC endonuclease subunit
MLRLSENYSPVASICGIDPGTNHLGFAVMEITTDSLAINSIHAFTLVADKLIEDDDLIAIQHTERIAKIYALQQTLTNLYNYYKPFTICCESPYYNHFRPNAYGALVEIIYAIRMSVINYNSNVRFQTYEPSIIKKAVGANAIAKKDGVKLAIKNNSAIIAKLSTSIDILDDHALDAIAVCFTHFNKLSPEVF